MQFLFSAMHAIAAKGGEGLRPELARALEQVKDNRAFGPTLGGAANRNGLEFVPCGRPEGLNVETLGPISLVQHGRKCSIHFEPNGTVTIVLGMRTYGAVMPLPTLEA
jgi:hypothetical protein